MTLTPLAGTEAVRAVEKARERTRDRQKKTAALQREWVLDSQLTAAELIAERDRLRAECMARNPAWFGATA